MKEMNQEEMNIQAWKAEHGKLYKSTIGDNVFIWRKLKRKDYVEIMAADDDTNKTIFDKQEEIAKRVVLFPDAAQFEAMIKDDGGLATTISDEILNKSGFNLKATEEL